MLFFLTCIIICTDETQSTETIEMVEILDERELTIDCFRSMYKFTSELPKIYKDILNFILLTENFISKITDFCGGNNARYHYLHSILKNQILEETKKYFSGNKRYNLNYSFAVHQANFYLDQIRCYLVHLLINTNFHSKKNIDLLLLINHNLLKFKLAVSELVEIVEKLKSTTLESIDPYQMDDLLNLGDYLRENYSTFSSNNIKTSSIFGLTSDFFLHTVTPAFVENSIKNRPITAWSNVCQKFIFRKKTSFHSILNSYFLHEISLCSLIEVLFFKLGLEEFCGDEWRQLFTTSKNNKDDTHKNELSTPNELIDMDEFVLQIRK